MRVAKRLPDEQHAPSPGRQMPRVRADATYGRVRGAVQLRSGSRDSTGASTVTWFPDTGRLNTSLTSGRHRRHRMWINHALTCASAAAPHSLASIQVNPKVRGGALSTTMRPPA